MAKKIYNLKGRKFGSLTVVGPAHRHPKMGQFWFCNCECGRGRIVLASRLTGKLTTACENCARKDRREIELNTPFDWQVVLSRFNPFQLRGYADDLAYWENRAVTADANLKKALIAKWAVRKAIAA